MSVLILNRASLAAVPYDQMLEGVEGPLVVLADAARMRALGENPADYAARYQIETFENYDLNDAVELRAVQLHAQYRFTQVVAMWEFDLARAARLRERFGFAGQNVASATVYRDKAVMKDAASAAGVGVTPYRRIESALDLIDFVAEHGLPVVVKPRNGGASLGIRIVRTPDELEALLAAGLRPNMESIPDLMVEKYVDGLLYHCDGIVLEGRLVVTWPALYYNDSLSFSEDRPLGSAILAPDHRLRKRLQNLVRTIIANFATPFATTFHCEIFHKADTDELLLCEIASRTGGNRVADMFKLGFGIDGNRGWVRNLCGLPFEIPAALDDPEVLPVEQLGWLAIPGHEGARFAYPDPATKPFDWIIDARYTVRPDQILPAATNNADFIATYVIRGETETQVRERLAELQTWVYEHFVMPEAEAAVPAGV
jgi:biotin carboxylase